MVPVVDGLPVKPCLWKVNDPLDLVTTPRGEKPNEPELFSTINTSNREELVNPDTVMLELVELPLVIVKEPPS